MLNNGQHQYVLQYAYQHQYANGQNCCASRALRPCTINSDDPLLFGSSLLQEFQRCRDQFLGGVKCIEKWLVLRVLFYRYLLVSTGSLSWRKWGNHDWIFYWYWFILLAKATTIGSAVGGFDHPFIVDYDGPLPARRVTSSRAGTIMHGWCLVVDEVGG